MSWPNQWPVQPETGAKRVLLACVSVAIGAHAAGFVAVVALIGLQVLPTSILIGLAAGAFCLGWYAVAVDLGWPYAFLGALALLLIGSLGASSQYDSLGGLAWLLGAVLFAAIAIAIFTDRPITAARVTAASCATILTLASILGPFAVDSAGL